MRYVQWAKLRKDGEDENTVIGVMPDAFRLRIGELTLSAAWLEFYSGERSEQIAASVHGYRKSSMKPTSKSGFVIGNVDKISDAVARYSNRKIRVIHEPEDDHGAHVSIHLWPLDNQDLFDELADGIWNELVLNRDIPNAPAE